MASMLSFGPGVFAGGFFCAVETAMGSSMLRDRDLDQTIPDRDRTGIRQGGRPSNSGVYRSAVDRDGLPGDEVAVARGEKNERAEEVRRHLVAADGSALQHPLA